MKRHEKSQATEKRRNITISRHRRPNCDNCDPKTTDAHSSSADSEQCPTYGQPPSCNVDPSELFIPVLSDSPAFGGTDRSHPPGYPYSRVRPRSPSPSRRSGTGGLNEFRPPMKRAREYFQSYLPPGHSRSSRGSCTSTIAPPTTPGGESGGLSDGEPGGISDDVGEIGEHLSGKMVDLSGSRVGHSYSHAIRCTQWFFLRLVHSLPLPPSFIENTQVVSSRLCRQRREDILL